MLIRSLIVCVCFLATSTSFALGLIPKSTIEKFSQAQAAIEVLEEKVGFSLSDEQRAQLIDAAADEVPNNFVEFASANTFKNPKGLALYCVGGSGALTMKMLRAGCVHIWTLTAYDMLLIGGGVAFSLNIHPIIKVVVTYDQSRYDNEFDPIPGEYGAVSIGGSLGIGMNFISGDSGNKELSASLLNVGVGIDLGTLSMIVIRD